MPFRNIESHFSRLPNANVKRTKMKYNFTNKFTFNAGDLVPFMVQEILPGDTLQINTQSLVRLATSIHPTMDNLYMDTYYFYVPNRLIWDSWTQFMGENPNPWAIDTSQYVPPYHILNTAGTLDTNSKYDLSAPESVLNYLGVPCMKHDSSGTPVDEIKATILDFNAYCKVWNDWFRDENLCAEVPIFKSNGQLNSSYYNSYASFVGRLKTGQLNASIPFDKQNSCLPVAKFHDYFTSALPAPQKGADVRIPVDGHVSLLDNGGIGGEFIDVEGNNAPDGEVLTDNGDIVVGQSLPLQYDPHGSLGFEDLKITINSLRLAVQTQRLLERDARGGTRYTEMLLSHFGVSSPDARLQRSEYLGGKRIPINMSQVVQNSETTNNSALGNLAGLSCTNSASGDFTKSFTEHGYVIGVLCVRPDRTYSQGLNKRYFRFNRLDYYFPVLANIGEQPILNKEIYCNPYKVSSKDINDEVFGYQEAWADYRYQQNRTCGFMSPGIDGSLDSWSYADSYNSTPLLSGSWLYQGKNEVDRTLAVQSSLGSQFIADFYVYGSITRPMPLYSVPGLIDHN